MRLLAVLTVLAMVAVSVPLGAGSGPSPTALGFRVYEAPAGMGGFAGEPSIGVNPHTGNVLYQAFTETLRVTFDDSVSPATASWASVGPVQTAITNNDPLLYTDRVTGRTFAGGLNPPCSVMAITEDDGQTWTPTGNMCSLPGIDHQTVASGAWRNPRPAQAIADRAVYYCAHTTLQMCAVSYDGGLTFAPAVPANPNLDCFGLFGKMRIAPDGTAYLPGRNCFDANGDERAGLMLTQSNGISWQTRTVPGSTVAEERFDFAVDVASGGWVYLAWESADGVPNVALSKNRGQTWTAPVDVTSGTGIETGTFVSVVAGDNDRAAVAFLGTKDAGDAFAESFTGSWDLYVSLTYDAGATWTTVRATQDPVQRGLICAGGTVGCPVDPETGSQMSRNLLDFIDVAMDTEGHVLVAFADGCVGTCIVGGDASDSQASKAAIARQSGGACLVAAKCGPASGTPFAAAFNDQCDSQVVIFSSHSLGTPAVNPHALACISNGASGVDTAILNPGSDRVSLRFTGDLGASVPTLTARVVGLGADTTVTLTRTVNPTLGTAVYNSPNTAIDPLARGALTAIVSHGATELDRVTFRTAA